MLSAITALFTTGLCVLFGAFVIMQTWAWHITPWLNIAPPTYTTTMVVYFLWLMINSSYAELYAVEKGEPDFVGLSFYRLGLLFIAFTVSWILS